jgi:hypothetical protein
MVQEGHNVTNAPDVTVAPIATRKKKVLSFLS